MKYIKFPACPVVLDLLPFLEYFPNHKGLDTQTSNVFEQCHVTSLKAALETSEGSDQTAHKGSLVTAFACHISHLWKFPKFPTKLTVRYQTSHVNEEDVMNISGQNCHNAGSHIARVTFFRTAKVQWK